MKTTLDVNVEEYFQWYATWINWKKVTAEEIKSGQAGVNPYGMFYDWAETKAIALQNSVGKKVYYSLNAEHKNAITTDTYIEGVSIHYGCIENVEDSSNGKGCIVTLDGKQYYISRFDADTTFFEEKDLLLATLHYDGELIYNGITLIPEFDNNLYEDLTE